MRNSLLHFFSTTLFICLGIFPAFGQVNIDYPSNRAVFQRDKNNNATIYIAGSYTKIIDRVEAILNAVNGGSSTNWITIQSNLNGGVYSGSIDATGGWYELQVRGWNGDQLVGSAQISKVGIGEVFLISGQSNAQGYNNYGGPGAGDDRVNCINTYNNNRPNSELDYPEFSHLDSDSYIAPRGNSAWSWGKLGDLLAGRLGVPILFYNVGWYGSAAKNWRESIKGTAYSVYNGEAFYPSGAPYNNLRSVFQTYVPMTGIRAVLWFQGEAESTDQRSTMASYISDLTEVIQTSRNESGKNVSWMVSLTTYGAEKGINPPIIEAQKQVIARVPNVFTGPNTDLIQIPRVDGVHFQNQGLTQLAEAWNGQLNDNFFASSEPYKAVSPLKINASCAGNNNLNLSVSAAGVSSVSWNNGQQSASIQVGNGNYRARGRDGNGNIIFSPEIKINQAIQPAQPVLTLEGSNPVCKGNTATLISNTSENLKWNTGQTSDKLTITTGGDYFVTTKNAYGCETASAKVAITVLTSPLPDKPSIAVTGALTFCDGGTASLKSTSNVKSVWSNGATDASIAVKISGDFRVRAMDNFGCFSPDSDPVTVKVNPLPARPVIGLSRSATFCEGENVVMTSNYDNGNIWTNNATSRAITITTAGTYSLKQRDTNGCESTSDPVTTKVNPLPATPTLAALRPTTFCDRDYTTLQSSQTYAYQWSNGGTSREVEIRNSGNYYVSAKDANGCLSVPTASIRVTVNPLPPKPVITAGGPTTFCADASVNLQSNDAAKYVWSNGAETKSVNINTSGDYSVKTINEFTCYSDPSNAVRINVLALPPSPTVQALGPVSFCDGDAVTLQASNGASFFWNTGEQKNTLLVSNSGSYKARVQDTQGCFSPYSREIVVDVKPLPSKPEIRQVGTYTLMAENNINDGNHVWQRNGANLSENGTMLKAVQSGTYAVNNTVIYSPVLTCFSDFSEPFIFTLDVIGGELSVYPNPSNDGAFTVETIADLENATVRVFDLNGRLLRTYPSLNFNERRFINLSLLSNGMYILSVQAGDYKKSKKIIIAQ